MIQTILIDDNPKDLAYIENLCTQINELDIVKTFSSGIDALKWLTRNEIDLIISDIEMPYLNGIDTIKQLKKQPNIIFISSHPEFAIESFEVQPLHYLSKPVSLNQLLTAINRIETKKNSITDHIYILQSKVHVKLFLSEILYIKSAGNFVEVHTDTTKYLVLSNLTQFTKQLPSDFKRVHKTTTINCQRIDSYTNDFVAISGVSFQIGNSYKSVILNELSNSSIQRNS